MDHSSFSAKVFDKLAETYRDKFKDLSLYNDSYCAFCSLLPPARARVLDAACGPGHVARFLRAQRPDLQVLGIDLAPCMVDLARVAVPEAQFLVHDCRDLLGLNQRFNGLLCAFGLPYLSWEESAGFINAAARVLDPPGVFYLSVMLGAREDSGFQRCSTGDEIYVNYHAQGQIFAALEAAGFEIVDHLRVPSPSAAAKSTTDLIILASLNHCRVAPRLPLTDEG